MSLNTGGKSSGHKVTYWVVFKITAFNSIYVVMTSEQCFLNFRQNDLGF